MGPFGGDNAGSNHRREGFLVGFECVQFRIGNLCQRMQINADNLTPENIAAFQQTQGQLSSALSRLLVSVERYPELKANQNFLDLQAQLEGTENRIAVARRRFNETVKDYNTYIRQFPRNLYAGMFDFEKKAYFKSEEDADKAPEVSFE